MRNLKKFLALVLAMMMTLSLMVTVNAAPATPNDFTDKDEITAEYKEAVNVLSALGIVKGDERGFRPSATINRAEVATMIYRIATNVKDSQADIYKDYGHFTDVDSSFWAAGYINYCANAELIKGRGGDKFDPKSDITGYELLAMLLRLLGYDQKGEFTGKGWETRTASFGQEVGITKGITEGTLSQPVTREVVAKMMFETILADKVVYNGLRSGYESKLLVDVSKVNLSSVGGKIYAQDVPDTIMKSTFGIIGKSNLIALDEYGRPHEVWVKDSDKDTVQNGAKWIVNPVATAAIAAATGNGVKGDIKANANAVYVPSSTPGATYGTITGGEFVADADWYEVHALEIPIEPVHVYKGEVVTECQFTTDVNGDKAINATLNVVEFLNGAKVATRGANDAGDGSDNYIIDALHTQEGTIGAAGRTTEVYKIDSKRFIIVYVDNFLGVVGNIVPRTFDTAKNHVMSPATMEITFNDNVTITKTSTTEDFEDYKKGDLVQFTTWGMYDQTTTFDDSGLVAVGTPTANEGFLQTTVPAVPKDFTVTDGGNEIGAVDVIGKAKTVDVTVKGTLGPKNHKNEIETSNGNYKANVVYLANQTVAADTDVQYYKSSATTDQFATADSTSTVPSDPNYSYAMNNAAINKEYTLVLDEYGFVIGMTQAESESTIGVVMGMEPVRIGTGKWAIEATLMMMDKTEKTVRMLQNFKAEGTAHNDGDEDKFFDYYESMNDAETDIGTGNLKAEAGVLVKIEAFKKNGETYYKVVETQNGEWKNYTAPKAVGDNQLVPGMAGTLADECTTKGDLSTFTINTDYSKSPSQIDNANAAVDQNVDNNTKFLIGELAWDYSLNEGNEGGYADLEYSAYTGFKNIPLIMGDNGQTVGTANTYDVLYQRIGNNVFVFPNMAATNTNLNYTVMARTPVEDPDLYLVYATGTTYQNYSTYKALKNGEPVELKVSNNNLAGINTQIEGVMAAGSEALVRVLGSNAQGHATSVSVNNGVTLAAADMVCFDKTGVIADNGTTDHDGDAVEAFYTVADDCVVKIVNLETGKYYDATLDSVKQYELYTGSHAFVLDFDEYDYVDTIYIID